MIYTFYDTDPNGHLELDIDGAAYYQLLSACFKYCTTFSMLVSQNLSNDPRIKALEKYRLPVTKNVLDAYQHYGDCKNMNCVGAKSEIRHYMLNTETTGAILQFCDSIFKWINAWGYANPEDPAFFRENGSIFFSSIIHEGECTIYPKANEDISEVVAGNLWQVEREI